MRRKKTNPKKRKPTNLKMKTIANKTQRKENKTNPNNKTNVTKHKKKCFAQVKENTKFDQTQIQQNQIENRE
jgi:hypothetical protein